MVQMLNRFESPEDEANRDNPLVLAGTVEGAAIDAIKSFQLTTYLADAVVGGSAFAFPGFAGIVTKITIITGGTIDSGTSTLQPKIQDMNIPGTTVIIGAGPPAGESFTLPTEDNAFSATDVLEVSATPSSAVGLSPLHIIFYVLPDEV